MERLLKKINDWSNYKYMIEELFGYEIDKEIQTICESLGKDHSESYTKKYNNDNTLLMVLAGDGFEGIFDERRGSSEQYLNLFKDIVEKNPKIINEKNAKEHSALIFAIISSTFVNGTEKAKLLIKHGAEVSDAKKIIEEFLLPIFTKTPLKQYTDIKERLQTILGYIKKRNKSRQLKFSPKSSVKLVSILGKNETLPSDNYAGMRGIIYENDWPRMGPKEPGVEEEVYAVEREKDDYEDFIYSDELLSSRGVKREKYMGDKYAKENKEKNESQNNKEKDLETTNKIWKEILNNALDD